MGFLSVLGAMLVVVFLTWFVSRWDARAAYRLFEHTEHVFFEPEPVEGAAVLGAKAARATETPRSERSVVAGKRRPYLSPLVKKGWPQNNFGGAVYVMCDWTRLTRSIISDPPQMFQTRSLRARIRKNLTSVVSCTTSVTSALMFAAQHKLPFLWRFCPASRLGIYDLRSLWGIRELNKKLSKATRAATNEGHSASVPWAKWKNNDKFWWPGRRFQPDRLYGTPRPTRIRHTVRFSGMRRGSGGCSFRKVTPQTPPVWGGRRRGLFSALCTGSLRLCLATRRSRTPIATRPCCPRRRGPHKRGRGRRGEKIPRSLSLSLLSLSLSLGRVWKGEGAPRAGRRSVGGPCPFDRSTSHLPSPCPGLRGVITGGRQIALRLRNIDLAAASSASAWAKVASHIPREQA